MATITLTDPLNGTIIDATLHANNNAALEATINGGLDTGNISPDAAIVDSQLASPNNNIYRLVHMAAGFADSGNGNGTWMMANGDGSLVQSGVARAGHVPTIYLDATEYDVSGLATKLNLRAQWLVNNVAPADTFKFGLYPLNSTGAGSGTVTYTLGTVVSGSEVTFASPSASTRNQGSSGDFAFPANGFYALAVLISGGAPPANHASSIIAHLRMRHV